MMTRRLSTLREFLASEAAGGVILMLVALAALVAANSPLRAAYFVALEAKLGPLSILHWVNDGLMAVFFLLVGLEIKRELLEGELSSWRRRALPGLAAAGGMVAPALIFVAVNLGQPENLRGWAIPTATDIAFALGVLALLGPRVPVSLKVFLTALAIIDDLGAVAIIAAFYTADVRTLAVARAADAACSRRLNRLGVSRLAPYCVLGVVLVVLRAAFGHPRHPCRRGAGVRDPASYRRPSRMVSDRRCLRLEHALQPWVAYLVVPVFGFANAGVSFDGIDLGRVAAPLPLGIALGLFLGKQIGVFGAVWIAVRMRWADRPDGASMTQVYGVALICGIGFTMSLFIGLLAFPSSAQAQDAVKIGVLAGSLLSAMAGALVLRLSSPARS